MIDDAHVEPATRARDYLALAHLPLAEVREEFRVPRGGATRW